MKYYTSTLQKGSKGNEVQEWQKFLNTQGYNLSVDGDFGEKTYAATTDYQTKNGLGADGIVGAKTWGKAGYSQSPSSTDWSYDDFSYDGFAYDQYKESEAVTNAGNALNQHNANKPGEYQSQWQTQIDDLMNKIMNREKFSYNFNEDALYQQYKDKYVQQGKIMMGDAIGQASSMTGGYGNSYAQSVGQQAYQQSLDNLNDIVPELYQMALDKYSREGQDLLNQYGMVMDRENLDYSRYRDSLSDFYTERDYLQGVYDSERGFDYGKYVDDRNFAYGQYSDDRNLAYDQYATDKNLSYQEYRDKIADEKWQKEYDFAVRQYEDSRKTAGYGGGSSGGSGGSGGSGSGGGSSSGGSGNANNTGNTTAATAVSDEIKNKASTFKDDKNLAEYLDMLEMDGKITSGQADALFMEYKQPDKVGLSQRNWSLVDNGGVNWFWGIDNNATVKDQYGNTYRLDKLVDALVAEGMGKSAAKDYVKKLQKTLGA